MIPRKRKFVLSRIEQNIIIFLTLVVAGLLMLLTSNRLHDISQSPPDLYGDWVGTATEDYGDFTMYHLEIDISNDYDDTVRGSIYYLDDRTTTDREAWSSYIGQTDGTTIRLREQRVLDFDNIVPSQWCMIEATLQYQPQTDRLIGNWQGIYTPGVGMCDNINGRIYLERDN